MAESYWQRLKRKLPGRRRNEPSRETVPYPLMVQFGAPVGSQDRPVYKPIPRNLRYFSHTPWARRAINSIKNPIKELKWEIVPKQGLTLNSELKRQIEVATYCFEHPNHTDCFETMLEAVVEDYLCGAGVIEMELSGDDARPLWMWPVDGLSIQMYAAWDGRNPKEARYYQTYGYGGGGTVVNDGIDLRDDEIVYIRPNPSTASPFGKGPLEIAFTSIARQLGAGDFAGNLASNAKPSMMLFFQNADATFINAFRQYWRNDVEGQGGTPITGGADAKSIPLYPQGDDALYLKWQEFCIRECAAAFDLSPQNLNIERDVNRSQGEVSEDRDWDQAIKPTANTISKSLTRNVLHKKLGFHQLEHRFVGLDREDEVATSEIYETYYRNNAITPNEQREKMGMPPMEGQWGDMTYADTEVTKAAAAGVKDNYDTDVPPERRKKPKEK